MRDLKFSILKALAIMLVVLSHAGISGWLFNFVFIFHVPAFFLCAGYFFNTRYLTDERTFVMHRVKKLYVPFLKWSVVLLLLHNVFFWCGLLSEQFGNAQGGVTHPYSLHQMGQHLWSIVFNMSGYDQFLGGTFWFFRALLLASIGFLILFKLLRRSPRFQTDKQAGWALLIVGLLLTTWKVADGLTMTGVAQGGYRELMGMTLMAAGFLLRQYRVAELLSWRWAAPAGAVLLLASLLFPSAMAWNPSFSQFVSLPVPAVAGFIVLLYASHWLDRLGGFAKQALVYIGERTLYIFAFHLLAFKVVSAIKVSALGLPWDAVGSHPVVHEASGNVLWIVLYFLVGMGLPLLWTEGYKRLAPHISFSQDQAIDFALLAAQKAVRLLFVAGRALWRLMIATWRAFVQGVKDILAASSTKDE